MIRLRILAALCALIAAPAGAAEDAPRFNVDLSAHTISITAGFDGARVVLYGARSGSGDVVAILRGPTKPVEVQRKDSYAGIWLNADSAAFVDAPAFYRVAASAPLDQIAPRDVRALQGVGLEHLSFRPPAGVSPEAAAAFRFALIRLKRARGLYADAVRPIVFTDDLFRVDLAFPADVPTGQYTVQVLLFEDGEIVAAQTTPLIVNKIGFSAAVARFAEQRAPLYGLLAVLAAAAAGWLVDRLLRRSG